MDRSLNNKVALVTGGSTGIGLAIARELVSEGAHVFITARGAEALDQAAKAIGDNVTAVQADATKPEDIASLFRLIGEQKGKLDIVVANAGVLEVATLADITPEFFDAQINANLRSVVYTVQGALPLLTGNSAVTLIGSTAAQRAFAGTSLYSAAKAAVRSLARTWALELKDRGIRVNVLSPGPVATEKALAGPQEFLDYMSGVIPMGRMGRPEEIAKAALFLSTEASSFLTGSELFADGGSAQL